MKNWKTTAAGVAAALGALLTAAGALLDADPATQPNWPLVFSLGSVAVGLVLAKDHTPEPPAPPAGSA